VNYFYQISQNPTDHAVPENFPTDRQAINYGVQVAYDLWGKTFGGLSLCTLDASGVELARVQIPTSRPDR
jgi:hypothetical protein